MFLNGSELNEHSLSRTLQGRFLPSFGSQLHLAKRLQRRRFFRNQPIRNKNFFQWPCLLTDRKLMSNLYKGTQQDASYHVSVHLAKRLQRRFFRNQPIRKNNCLWRPCLLNRSELNEQSSQMTFQGCFLPCFNSFVKVV